MIGDKGGLQIRELVSEDYDTLLLLWKEAGVVIGKSDLREEYGRFLRHNPRTSLGLILDGRLFGAVLGGYDGRRGNGC